MTGVALEPGQWLLPSLDPARPALAHTFDGGLAPFPRHKPVVEPTPCADAVGERSASAGTAGRLQGLVICAKTRRKPTIRAFPTRDLVGAAAATLAASSGQPLWDGGEGPRWFVTVSPGSIKVGTVNLGKAQRADEREHGRRRVGVDIAADELRDESEWEALRVLAAAGLVDAPGLRAVRGDPEGRVIEGWSRKSRTNMTRRLLTLDYNDLGGRLQLVTLTYPGEWLSVAPDGAAVKRHLGAWRRRWQRRFGSACRAVWKMEFQRRGAPHFHLLLSKPAGVGVDEFRQWVASAWSAVLAHKDPVQRGNGLLVGTRVDDAEHEGMTDPRRTGVYFAKHGSYGAKEYQNHPPAEWAETGSVGRFWGYWAIKPAEVAAAVSPDQALDITRTLRRLNRQHRYLRPVTVQRIEQATGRISLRTCRRPVHRMPGSRGFVAVNDGPDVALSIVDRVLLVGLGPVIAGPTLVQRLGFRR